VCGTDVKRGKSKSCGKCKEFIINNGDKFGKLLVVREDHIDKNRQHVYLCICDCGNETLVRKDHLKDGSTKSCSCTTLYNYAAGDRFGRLVIIKQVDSTWDLRAVYECRCDCGQVKKIMGQALKSGFSKSCGCYGKEQRLKSIILATKRYRIQHGFDPNKSMSKHNLYLRGFQNRFIQKIKERDKFTCQLCGNNTDALEVHHIFKFSETLDNSKDDKKLITLCDMYHYRVHGLNYRGNLDLNIQQQLLVKVNKLPSL
jgi:hypothetical protein